MVYFSYSSSKLSRWLCPAVIAGVAGGLTEILWIALYGSYSAVDALEVARQISVTVIPATADAAYAPALGMFIHLLLSITLALAFSYTALPSLYRRYGGQGIFLWGLVVLALVWKMNFFVILPLINPSFVSIMPLSVTLISKLAFGAAMAGVLMIMAPMRVVTHRGA